MYPDTEWLIAALAEGGLSPCRGTIEAIISSSPREDRSRLMDIAKNALDAEYAKDILDSDLQEFPYAILDAEMTIEDLLNQKGSVRGEMHNL